MPHVSERTEKIAGEVLAAALDWASLRKMSEEAMSQEEKDLFNATEKFRNEGGVSLAGDLVMMESQTPNLINGRVGSIHTKPPNVIFKTIKQIAAPLILIILIVSWYFIFYLL